MVKIAASSSALALEEASGTDVKAQAAPPCLTLLRAVAALRFLPFKLSKVDCCLSARWWSAPASEASGRLSCHVDSNSLTPRKWALFCLAPSEEKMVKMSPPSQKQIRISYSVQTEEALSFSSVSIA